MLGWMVPTSMMNCRAFQREENCETGLLSDVADQLDTPKIYETYGDDLQCGMPSFAKYSETPDFDFSALEPEAWESLMRLPSNIKCKKTDAILKS